MLGYCTNDRKYWAKQKRCKIIIRSLDLWNRDILREQYQDIWTLDKLLVNDRPVHTPLCIHACLQSSEKLKPQMPDTCNMHMQLSCYYYMVYVISYQSDIGFYPFKRGCPLFRGYECIVCRHAFGTTNSVLWMEVYISYCIRLYSEYPLSEVPQLYHSKMLLGQSLMHVWVQSCKLSSLFLHAKY